MMTIECSEPKGQEEKTETSTETEKAARNLKEKKWGKKFKQFMKNLIFRSSMK
jgi:hypothetical protein